MPSSAPSLRLSFRASIAGPLTLLLVTACGATPRVDAPLVPNGPDTLPGDEPSSPILPSISVGPKSVCATREGEVWCWGDGGKGRLGRPVEGISKPIRVEGVKGALRVAVTSDFACARLSDGRVSCWGDGPLEAPEQTISGPHILAGLDGVVAISASEGHLCAIRVEGEVVDGDGAAQKAGRVTCVGRSGMGQLGDLEKGPHRVDVPGITDATTIATTTSATCVTHAAGGTTCWGNAAQIGEVDTMKASATAPHRVSYGVGAIAVTGATFGFCVTNGAGTTMCRKPARVGGVPAHARVVAPAQRHGCALDEEGVLCWGDGQSAALGRAVDVTANQTYAAERVPGTEDVVAISSGADVTCFARTSGEVQCFGRSKHGRLGDGAGDEIRVATPVEALGPTRSAVLGSGWGCGLSGDTVHCWGTSYMAGDAAGVASTSPPLRLLTQARVVDPSVDQVMSDHTNAVLLHRTDGSVAYMKGGFDTATPLEAPRDLPALSGVVGLTGGGGRSYALMKNGEVRSFRTPASATEPDDVAVSVVRGLSAYRSLTVSSFAPTLGCGVLPSKEVECFRTTSVLLTQPTSASVVKKLPVRDVARVSTSAGMACAEPRTGELRCFELSDEGELSEVALTVPAGLHAVALIGGKELCGIDARGRAGCSTSLGGALAPSPTEKRWFEVAGVDDAVELVLTHPNLCVLDGKQALRCVGSNENDRLAVAAVAPWAMLPKSVDLR